MHQLASEELFGVANVTLLAQDALRNKNTFAPEVLAAVEQLLAGHPERRFKLVANLPYNIATPVVANLLALERCPVSMTITIQKELADRIVASPGTKEYGALSVWVQSQCRASLVRTLPPSVFWPRPKVTSAILHLTVDESLRSRVADLGYFQNFVRTAFFHRRKVLRSVLHSAWKDHLAKTDVDAILAGLRLPADAARNNSTSKPSWR